MHYTNCIFVIIMYHTVLHYTYIGHNKIICSGITIAGIEGAYTYVTYMAKILLGEPTTNLLEYDNKFPSCERNGVDQGILILYIV